MSTISTHSYPRFGAHLPVMLAALVNACTVPNPAFDVADEGAMDSSAEATSAAPSTSPTSEASSEGTPTSSNTETGGAPDATSSAPETGEPTTGGALCAIGWDHPFVYGEAGVNLDLTNAARDPNGDLILVGRRPGGSSFVLKVDGTSGQASWATPTTLTGFVTDVAAGPLGIYVSGFEGRTGSTDSFLYRLDGNGTLLMKQGGPPDPSNDKAYALTVAANGRVATTGYCATARKLLVGIRDPDLAGPDFACTPDISPPHDIRGWDIIETPGGFLVAGQWTGSLEGLNSPAPSQSNFLAHLDANGVMLGAVELAPFGSTRVDAEEFSNLPAVHLAAGANGTILAAGRMKEGSCKSDCLPAVAQFDSSGNPLGEPQVLTPSGGVVTGIAADDKAGVFVSGVTGVPTFKGEGEARSGRAFGAQRDASLAHVRRWAMSTDGACERGGACSSVENVIVDPNNELVFWAGSFTSAGPLTWEDDHDGEDPIIAPAVPGVANVFVIPQCM